MTINNNQNQDERDQAIDAQLLVVAAARMGKADSLSYIPAERLYEELGITKVDLDSVGDGEIE